MLEGCCRGWAWLVPDVVLPSVLRCPGSGGRGAAVQVLARRASRACALIMCSAQGQVAGIFRTCRRPVRTTRPATPNRRSRSRFGSAMRAHPVRASRWVKAINSAASAQISSQTRFWAASWNGRLRSPVSLPARIRSSTRAWRRCRSSRSASCPPGVFGEKPGDPVAVQVGDTELRARMWAFLPQHQSDTGRPGRHISQSGHLGHPRSVAGSSVGVVGRCPRCRRNPTQDGVNIEMVQVGAYRELHAQLVDAGGEGVGGASGVGTHQDLHLPVFVGLAQVGGDLCEGVIQHGEVVGRAVFEPALPRRSNPGDGFPGTAVAVIAEHQQWVESERPSSRSWPRPLSRSG